MSDLTKKSGAKYQKRVVAFVDILGFRDFVEKSKGKPQLIDALHSAITDHSGGVLDYVKRLAEPEYRITTTSFSDCIVISTDGTPYGLAAVMMILSETIVRLQFGGLFCRGAIDVGLFYHTDQVAFGPSLVKAYELESNIAGHPQVILSSAALKMLDSACSDKDYNEYFSDLIVQDKDTKLVRLEAYGIFDEEHVISDNLLPFSVEEFCKEVRNVLIERLRDNVDNPSVFRKYDWASKRLNELIARKDVKVDPLEAHHIFKNFSKIAPLAPKPDKP